MSEPTIDVHLSSDHAGRALRRDVRAGLAAKEKWLSPKWFYDARGSDLFEQITRLPEYYPTRAETEALRTAAADIAGTTKARTVVELGAGSSEKTRLLLDALLASGSLRAFVPQDVSVSALRGTAAAIGRDYPALRVHGVVGDFTADLAELPGEQPRLVAFLGGTIGNFLPEERAELLQSMAAVLEPGEWLLLGTDLVKDPDVLVAAYDDAQRVTAEFNRNVLHVLNRELGADFDVEAFAHVALWNDAQEWIEMRLRAQRPMHVHVRDLDMRVRFAAGEDLRTEISAKFRPERIRAELAAGGFDLQRWWTDTEGRFGVSLAQRVAAS
jgi:L-histidine Nalpha-methyltransferase